jgi:succinate dehydrogenase / fumarate reductase cytochrome b subunit
MKSSLIRKFVMAITGLFLISFISIHLLINSFSLGWGWDGMVLFNKGSHFMATNPIIQAMQFVLAAGFLIHIIWGIILTLQNNKARKIGYAKNNPAASSGFSSRTMIYSGGLVLLFLILHMKDFFLEVKSGTIPMVPIESHGTVTMVQNDYSLMENLFAQPLYVVIYLISFILLAIHLHHGFQSAFQTMGASHPKYTPIIKKLGFAFCIIIGAGFSAIALTHYFHSL